MSKSSCLCQQILCSCTCDKEVDDQQSVNLNSIGVGGTGILIPKCINSWEMGPCIPSFLALIQISEVLVMKLTSLFY